MGKEPIASQPSTAEILRRYAECHGRLEGAGLSYDDLQLPINNKEARRRLVGFWKCGARGPTGAHLRAREGVTTPMVDIIDMASIFGINPPDEYFSRMNFLPFRDGILSSYGREGVLFPGFPISAREMFEKFPDYFFQHHRSGEWFHRDFANQKVESRWYLICSSRVRNTLGMEFSLQKEKLVEGEEVPTLSEMVFMAILSRELWGKMHCNLPEETHLRCSHFGRGGYPLFGNSGKGIEVLMDSETLNYSSPSIGLAAKMTT